MTNSETGDILVSGYSLCHDSPRDGRVLWAELPGILLRKRGNSAQRILLRKRGNSALRVTQASLPCPGVPTRAHATLPWCTDTCTCYSAQSGVPTLPRVVYLTRVYPALPHHPGYTAVHHPSLASSDMDHGVPAVRKRRCPGLRDVPGPG